MDLAAILSAVQVLISQSVDRSLQCGGSGANVTQFCSESTHVFSTSMYVNSVNISNDVTDCSCRISATEDAPVYISLVGSPFRGDCDTMVKVKATNNLFTIHCDDEVNDGKIAFLQLERSATVTLYRGSTPRDMCTMFYIADGNPPVTMSCFKSRSELTTPTTTTTSTTTSTTTTTTSTTTSTTTPTTTTTTTTTPTPTTTTTTPTTTRTVETTNTTLNTTTPTTTTVKETPSTTTTKKTTKSTKAQKTSQTPTTQDPSGLTDAQTSTSTFGTYAIIGTVAGFVVLLAIVVGISMCCASRVRRRLQNGNFQEKARLN